VKVNILRQGGDIKKRESLGKKSPRVCKRKITLDILKHYQILIVNPNVERNNGEDLDD
jgi:hypothetical protein